jgi:16S rRNA (guanine966-N2)-methyltransferase
MRIIAGIHRTRQIEAPEGLLTRPMTDRVRENLFNLLGDTVVNATVLDLFCGSGALGIEALSRGATRVTFVDTDLAAVSVVETNCKRLGLEKQARILRRDVLRPGPWIRPVGAKDYALIFIDPPYKMSAEPGGQAQLAAMVEAIAGLECVARGALAMIRVERNTRITLPWAGFEFSDQRSYGTTTLCLMTYLGKEAE